MFRAWGIMSCHTLRIPWEILFSPGKHIQSSHYLNFFFRIITNKDWVKKKQNCSHNSSKTRRHKEQRHKSTLMLPWQEVDENGGLCVKRTQGKGTTQQIAAPQRTRKWRFPDLWSVFFFSCFFLNVYFHIRWKPVVCWMCFLIPS